MKAARILAYHKPLVLEDIAVPDIQADEVLVKVAACGMCRSDVLLVDGFFQTYADIPPPLMSRATPFASMAQQLSMSFGVGTGALLLHLTLAFQRTSELTANDFTPAFIGVGLISLAALPIFLQLSPEAGASVIGRRRSAAGAE